MIMNHGRKMAFALMVVLCLELLAGCRHSQVLEQVVYTMEDEVEVDYDNETKVNDNQEDNTEPDETLTAKDTVDDSDTERDYDSSAPTQGEGDSDGTVADTQYEPDSNEEQQGQSPGQTESETENVTAEVETVPEEIVNDEIGTTPEDIVADEVETTPEEIIIPDNTRAMRQIVDATGAEVDIPESVNTVAAVGQAAVLVQMLGGANRLVASSADFTENALAGNVFADEGFAAIETLWSGSGSSAPTDISFERLLERKPDVCIIISGQTTFSDAQLATLAEREIACVTISKLNTSAGLKLAATLVGEVLGDKSEEGGTNAPALAADYADWYDGIISNVSNRVARFTYHDIDYDHDRYATRTETTATSQTDSGFYTILISAWDSEASYQLTGGGYITRDLTGLAVVDSGYSTSPVSYYMSLGGVINTPATLPDQFKLRHWYVNPLIPSTREIGISGMLGVKTEQRLTSIADTLTAGNIYLGQERFPAVIVADSAVKSALVEDKNSQEGLWRYYGDVSSADGNTHGYGFTDESGQIIASDIRGEYEIYVNPFGVSSWMEGSAEGVLESMWIASIYYNAYSQEELIQEVQAFYSQFYRCDISTSTAAGILAGR